MRITIEIAGDQNQGHVFAPLGEKLRGRWDTARAPRRGMSEGLAELLSAVPVIPGECLMLEITGKKMEGRRFDPLRETPDGKQLWAKIEPIIARHQREFGNIRRLREPAIHKLSEFGDDGTGLVKDWLWAMRQAVAAGHARLVDGSDELPSIEKIRAMTGKRSRDPRNSGPQEEKLTKFVDIVGEPAAIPA